MTVLHNAGILGLGSATGDRILTNGDLERLVDTSDEWIVERTGISERRVLGPGKATSDLAWEAARKALETSGVCAAELDLIVVATVTPDMPFPATACLLQDRLGARKAAAFDLEAACSGFLYGLVIASQFIRLGTYRYVLVIGAETLSRITDWTDRSTCVLFGDGAGAAVLGPVGTRAGVLGWSLGADGSGADLLKMPAGGSRMPASTETVARRLHYIRMNGREVFKRAVTLMQDAGMMALRNAGLDAGQVDLLIPHQANLRIIEALRKKLRMPREKVFWNLDRYGNMSSASVPVALEEALQAGRVRPGDVLLMVAFGAGLTWGAVVMRWPG
ncbi:MAG TPA: 3-oxoacyl-ACP synthase [Clostridiales bacterium]|nr:3-oxoacyl-ACP synthase [Clostridiales bacterium]